jgi:hypothetical protein
MRAFDSGALRRRTTACREIVQRGKRRLANANTE